MKRSVLVAVGGALLLLLTTSVTALEIHHIHGLAVDPANPEILYVATHDGLIRGEDGRWSLVGEHRADYMGFALHPGTPGLMAASGHPPAGADEPNPVGVIVSRDDGRTWRPLALEGQADFHVMALSPADGDTLYGWSVGPRAGLFRISLKSGQAAQIQAQGLTGVLALAAHPKQAETVAAGTRTGLLVSTDGGRRWASLAFSGQPVSAVGWDSADPSRLFAYPALRAAKLMMSPDGGRSWMALDFSAGSEDAVGWIAFHPKGKGLIFLATFGSDVIRSRDDGRRWETLIKHGQPVGRAP